MEDLNDFLVKTLSNDQNDQDFVKNIIDSIKDDKESIILYLNKFNDLTERLKRVAVVHMVIFMKNNCRKYDYDEMKLFNEQFIQILEKYSDDIIISSNILTLISMICLFIPDIFENTINLLNVSQLLYFLRIITTNSTEYNDAIAPSLLNSLLNDSKNLSNSDFTNLLYILLNISDSIDISSPNIKNLISERALNDSLLLNPNEMRTFWMLMSVITNQY